MLLSSIRLVMLRVRLSVEVYRVGVISFVVRLLKLDWKKVWQEVVRLCCLGKGLSVRMVRQGMVSDMLVVQMKIGSMFYGKVGGSVRLRLILIKVVRFINLQFSVMVWFSECFLVSWLEIQELFIKLSIDGLNSQRKLVFGRLRWVIRKIGVDSMQMKKLVKFSDSVVQVNRKVGEFIIF